MASEAAALVVTLKLESQAAERFEALRRTHYPADRNHVPAHVSLFHALPGAHFEFISNRIRETCSARTVLAVEVTGVRSLGRGVAFTLESPELLRVRGSLAQAFEPWLTPQDRQRYQPHITVQNKATAAEAARVYQALQSSFSKWTITGTGIKLWHYLGGPWALAGSYHFRARPS